MSNSPQASDAPAAAPAAKTNKLLIGLVILVSLVSIAMAVLVLRGQSKAAHSQPQKEEAPAPKAGAKPIFIPLEAMTVNLYSEGRPRFLHVGLVLKVHDEKDKAHVDEVMPEMRSRALLLLSNRDPATLLSAEDKTRLAAELTEALRKPLDKGLPGQEIDGVSFVTFVVQ